MILIAAENRELALSISINQRNPNQSKPRHGVLLGTDFRHAVEFSKSGRAETRPSRAPCPAGCPTLRRFPAPPSGDLVRRTSRSARRMENDTRAPRGRARGSWRPPPHLRQATPLGRNCTLTRGPTCLLVLGMQCSQVRWQEPPITTRSPWPSGKRRLSPPPAGRSINGR